jgi:hypothetical protein
MSSTTYNKFLKSFPNADANIQVANINSYLKNKELQTYIPLSLNNGVENVKATNNMITVTKNFDVLLSIDGLVSPDSLLQIGDLLYIGGDFSVEYKGVTHKNFISFNRVTGEINGFNGLGNPYIFAEGGIIENNGSIYVSFINDIENVYFSTLYKITNNVPTIIETPPNAYIVKMGFDKNGKFYICSTIYTDNTEASTIYEYSENNTWTSITSSIPGFKCRGFAFDTNNVLYAVCNTSAKKCLYRKALDSNQWTPLVNGEIRRYGYNSETNEYETILNQPNIIINKYNELYIYGSFTEINGEPLFFISKYNEKLHIFEKIVFNNADQPISSVVFDNQDYLYIDGRNDVQKLIFNNFKTTDINYDFIIDNGAFGINKSQAGYSLLLNNNEMIIPYLKVDNLDNITTDIVSYKLNSKKTVITDRQLQYNTKIEQKFYVNKINTITQARGEIIMGCSNGNEQFNISVINLENGEIGEGLDSAGFLLLNKKYYDLFIQSNIIQGNTYILYETDYYYVSDLIIFNPFLGAPESFKCYTPPSNSFIQKYVTNDNKYIYTNLYNGIIAQQPTFYGIYMLSTETNTWRNISSSIENFVCFSICLDKNDNLYAVGYTGDNCLFLKNKDNDEWVPLASGNIVDEVGNNTVGILVIDNNDELYMCGNFVKIGDSNIAYIAKYNTTLKAFENVGNPLQSFVTGIAFDSQNNIYIAQPGETNIKTLINNVWKYVNIDVNIGININDNGPSVAGVINITNDVLVASYSIEVPNDFDSTIQDTVISYDLNNKKTTYPGWVTTYTKETGSRLEFNKIGQSVQIFTNPNDNNTNAIILNKSEGVILSNEYTEPFSKQSKPVKPVKSKNGLFNTLNTKSIFGRHL